MTSRSRPSNEIVCVPVVVSTDHFHQIVFSTLEIIGNRKRLGEEHGVLEGFRQPDDVGSDLLKLPEQAQLVAVPDAGCKQPTSIVDPDGFDDQLGAKTAR